MRLPAAVILILLYSPASWSWDGHYDLALQKYLWIHRESLAYDRSFVGVRLSYALHDWKVLGQEYAPALEAMTAVRNDTERAIRDATGSYSDFMDIRALNSAKKGVGVNIIWL
jgi:hypothetical protein